MNDDLISKDLTGSIWGWGEVAVVVDKSSSAKRMGCVQAMAFIIPKPEGKVWRYESVIVRCVERIIRWRRGWSSDLTFECDVLMDLTTQSTALRTRWTCKQAVPLPWGCKR